MNTPAAVLAHGYTTDDASRIAGRAARDHYAAALSFSDRRDSAEYAIVTVVLDAAAAPTVLELLNAGRDAISAATAAEYHHRGLSARDPRQQAPGFARYWHGAGPAASPWEDDLIERIALGQITGILPGRFARDLQALADHGTYHAAARSLGTTDATFKVRISQARAAFRAWWHEHEQPSPMWGSDRRADGPRARAVTHCIRARARDRQAHLTGITEGGAAA